MAADPFDINLRHLRALIAIEEHGSITAAADAVSLSQPALTQGLAKLERQFGYTFFERRSGGMVATAMGRIVVARAQAAIEHLSAGAKGLSAVFLHPDRLMTMTQLRALLAVAEAGSFAGAANVTGLSQTAVHRAVGDLEQVIGATIVERRGRVVWLNAAGKRLARGTRLALAEISAAIVELAIDGGGGSEQISFGALPLSRPLLVPAAMAQMVRAEPRAAFKILEGSWRELVEPLRDGVIDMIVGALRPYEIADLYQLPLVEDRLIVVGGSQHPLVGQETPSMEQLASYPWVVSPPSTPSREQWERVFKGASMPATPIECSSVMIIGRLLWETNFLTLLSPDQVALQIRSGLLAQIGQPLEGTKRTVGITTRRSWRPTATQRRFLDMLREAATQMRSEENQPGLRDSGWL
jgi:DNA-binding transcriptional LysR family regulator